MSRVIIPVSCLLLTGVLAGCGKSSSVNDTTSVTEPRPEVPAVTPQPVVAANPPQRETPTAQDANPTPLRLPVSGIEIAAMPRLVGEEATPISAELQAPPKVDPPKPDVPKADPPTTPTQPTEPKKYEYPKKIDDKDVVWWLNEARKNPDPQARQAALNVIPGFGPDARKPAISPLIDIVTYETDPGVRMAAITLIGLLGFDERADERRAILAINGVLANAGQGTLLRAYCLKAISAFGPDAAVAIPNVRACLFDTSWETRVAAANALGMIGQPPIDDPKEKKGPNDKKPDPKKTTSPSGSGAVPEFDMKSPNPDALRALINTGLKDPCMAVRLEATQSLLRCGAPVPKDPMEYAKCLKEFMTPLNQKTNEKDEMGRVNTLREKNPTVLVWLYLVQIMYNSDLIKDNVPKIAAMIKHSEIMTRVNALNALSLMGNKAFPALNDMIEALKYDEPVLLLAAMNAIGAMGKDGGQALPELEKIKAGAKDPKKPMDAPKDWKPDDTLRKVAAETIDYVTGKKKVDEPKKEEPKK